MNISNLPISMDMSSQTRAASDWAIKGHSKEGAPNSSERSGGARHLSSEFQDLVQKQSASQSLNQGKSVTKADGSLTATQSSIAKSDAADVMNFLQEKDRAIVQFFEDMQKRLGLLPEQWIEAFSKLSDEDLMAPPRDTAEQFIEHLELEPNEKSYALSSYLNMLNRIEEAEEGIPTQEKPFKLPLTLNEKLKDRRIYEIEQKQRIEKLNADIQKLSDKFFMRRSEGGQMPPRALAAVAAPSLPAAEGMNASEASVRFLSGSKVESAAEIIPTGSLNGGGVPIRGPSGASTPYSMETLTSLGGAKDSGLMSPATLKSPTTLETQARLAQVSEKLNLFKEISARTNQDLASATVEGAAFNSLSSGKKEGPINDLNEDFEKLEINPEAILGSSIGVNRLSQAGKGELIPTSSNAGEASEPLAKQLQEPIQFFVRNERSGEARIKLNPDQLGEVVLNVQVQDGRANVQILAQNREAQTLIERDIDELRRSLASNQVVLDRIEVKFREMATAEIATQAGPDQRDPSKSADLPGFFQQFQGQGFSRRDDFIEMPAITQYRGVNNTSAGPDPLRPVGEPRKTQDGRGERVNKVV